MQPDIVESHGGVPGSPFSPELLQDRRFRAGILAARLVLAVLARVIGLGTSPPPHATDDEYWYAWSGLSMLHGQKPTSWSLLEGYRGHTLGWGYLGNTRYHFVRPALDHPPLFPL